MVVVEFVGNAPTRRCRRTVRCGKGARTGHEFHFADQAAAPRLVDAVAEIVGHLLELFLPGLGVGRDVEAAILASQWASVACQSFAHDLRPGAREPSESSLGAIQSSGNASQNVGGFIHRVYLRFSNERRGTASTRHEGSSARSTRFDSRAYELTRSRLMAGILSQQLNNFVHNHWRISCGQKVYTPGRQLRARVAASHGRREDTTSEDVGSLPGTLGYRFEMCPEFQIALFMPSSPSNTVLTIPPDLRSAYANATHPSAGAVASRG